MYTFFEISSERDTTNKIPKEIYSENFSHPCKQNMIKEENTLKDCYRIIIIIFSENYILI